METMARSQHQSPHRSLLLLVLLLLLTRSTFLSTRTARRRRQTLHLSHHVLQEILADAPTRNGGRVQRQNGVDLPAAGHRRRRQWLRLLRHASDLQPQRILGLRGAGLEELGDEAEQVVFVFDAAGGGGPAAVGRLGFDADPARVGPVARVDLARVEDALQAQRCHGVGDAARQRVGHGQVVRHAPPFRFAT